MRYRNLFKVIWLLFMFGLLLCACSGFRASSFNGDQALQYAQYLMSIGNRIPGSDESIQTTLFLTEQLTQFDWEVEFQDFSHKGVLLRNVIAKKTDSNPKIIIGTHFDTRQISDQEDDPVLRSLPVPGANDGTSGTVVLLELARSLQYADINIWLVFFDGEDQGNLDDWEWSVGAQYFADHLQIHPEKVVIIDMIGDRNLNIYKEKNSDPVLTEEIWSVAKNIGMVQVFINEEKYTMADDHLPFVKKGIPSCLVIDFNYPYWHTQSDTIDKISKESLNATGQVLLEWLNSQY